MSFKLASMESFSFDGEEIGAAGAAALRKVRTLADSAPKGRLFAAIATLNELSGSAAHALEKGDLGKAKHAAAELAKSGEVRLPGFFQRKA
jgi:hypothetical protein